MYRFLVVFLSVALNLQAEPLSRLDPNQDGILAGLAFGDSITFGIGDPTLTGYPARLSTLVGIPIDNAGVPGEKISANGIARFPARVQSSSADFVIFMEGANDAIVRLGAGEYERNLQQIINIVGVLGKEAVLLTLPAPCCDHIDLAPFTDAYSGVVKNLAADNDLLLADLQRSWQTTCSSSACELYDLSDGLHPNGLGYDAIAQTIAATIFGVDIFAPDGGSELESALGLAAGSVVVKPDPALVEP